MRKLFLTGSRKYGFAHDFYQYVLRGLGFERYNLDYSRLSDAKYLLHLFRKKYHIIWCCSSGRGFITILCKLILKKRLKNTQIVTRFHRDVNLLFKEKGWKAYATIMAVDKVVWVYDCFKELKKYVPAISSSDFFVVHNGINLNIYKPPPNNKKNRTNLIFTVSSWHSPIKCLEVLISAMELLPNWELVIAGKFLQKDYEVYCKSLAKKIGRVRFVGFASVEDKVSWMQKAKVFVMPSRYEAWSTQVMEAMACGCKVLRVEGGGASEFLPEQEILPRNFNAETLAKRILTITDNDDLVEQNLEAVKQYTWDKVYEETRNVLESLGEL